MVLALLVLIGSNWSYLIHSPLLADYFYGPRGLVTVLQASSGNFSSLWEAVVAGPLTYNVLVLVVAATVGLLVYGFLEGFDRIVSRTSQTLINIKDPNFAYSQSVRAEVSAKLSVRIMGILLMVVYWIIFSKLILPFSLLVFRDGLDAPFTSTGMQFNAVGLIVLLLGLHIHVILLRVVTLRLRIFGIKPELYS